MSAPNQCPYPTNSLIIQNLTGKAIDVVLMRSENVGGVSKIMDVKTEIIKIGAPQSQDEVFVVNDFSPYNTIRAHTVDRKYTVLTGTDSGIDTVNFDGCIYYTVTLCIEACTVAGAPPEYTPENVVHMKPNPRYHGIPVFMILLTIFLIAVVVIAGVYGFVKIYRDGSL